MKIRSLLQWVGFAALALLLILARHRIIDAGHQAVHARWYILVLFIVMQVGSYWFNAKYYQSFFKIFGYKVPVKVLYIRSLVVNFVNQAFPSGGISGTSYLSTSLKAYVPPGKTTLAQVMNYAFTVASFLIVLSSGFILLFLTGRLDQASVRVIMLFILIIVIVAIVTAAIVNDRRRVHAVARVIVRRLNGFCKKVFRFKRNLISDAKLDRFIEEFYHGYQVFSEERGHWRMPFLNSLGYNVTEVATIYVVFLAFGSAPNPGAVIVAYTLANLLSFAAIFTNGAGVYEATMIGTLVALGVPFNTALPVVVVYRVLNFAVFLPIGYYYYRKTV